MTLARPAVSGIPSGGDLFRTIQSTSADYEQAIAENKSRLVDAAEVRIDKGESRPFLNISSVGLEADGEIVEARDQGGMDFRFRLLPGAFPLVM